MTPTAAYYYPTTGTLVIVFDGELAEGGVDASGFSAVSPSGKTLTFAQDGTAANDGGIGIITFEVAEGGETEGEAEVRYSPSGHEVYVTKGRRAVPGTDSPAAVVSTDELSAVIDAEALGLEADADYCVEVYAFNATGRSVTAAETWVRTDAEGEPQVVPMPVSGLNVTPLADGAVLVEWEYAETDEARVADEFVVTLTPNSGEPTVANVSNAGEGRFSETYSPGGTWVRVSVQSRRDGVGAGYVPAVECLVDAGAHGAGVSGAEVG